MGESSLPEAMVKFEGSGPFPEIVWVCIERLHHRWLARGASFAGPKFDDGNARNSKAIYETNDGAPTTRKDGRRLAGALTAWGSEPAWRQLP